MCDRCSHSLFHAPHLNNSPCTDNPRTQDHLHGTAEPGNFLLRPSVCFCSITATGAQGTPKARLYSAEEESSFHCTSRLPVSPLKPCFVTREALSWGNIALTSDLTSKTWSLGNIFQMQQSLALRCSAAASRSTGNVKQAVPHSAWKSRNHSILSWSSNCVGALTAEASSVLTAAASGKKCWHLLNPFLPRSLPPQCIPIRRPSIPCWAVDREVKWLRSCISMSSPGVFTITVESIK